MEVTIRLNWFSPLPPQRTDIAHYTGRIASALMDRFDMVFWTDLPANARELPHGADVRTFSASGAGERKFNEELFEGLNIYNLGNDYRFHSGIAEIARRIPGLVVLHDTRLHDFVFGSSSEETPRFSSYLRWARRHYGADGEAAARNIIKSHGRLIGEFLDQMPFVEAFVDNAIGLICHSGPAALDLRRRTEAPVLPLPLPFASSALASRVERRWTAPWRFVAFGYMNENRRLKSVLRALASWPDPPDFRFDIFGSLLDQTVVQELSADTRLASCTTIHGFVSEQALDAAIAAAHLVFNLRHPTMGEASGGILRAWAQAAPALVTNSGWYADLPDSAVRKVSVENEIADIRRALSDLVTSPKSFEEMGLSARKLLKEEHSPQAYVDGLAAALEDLEPLMTRFASRRLLADLAAKVLSPAERKVLLERASELIPALFEPAQGRRDPMKCNGVDRGGENGGIVR
jgi:glycosyltransferase involved in cell wall biosynthesis